jgi:hypothetical protein
LLTAIPCFVVVVVPPLVTEEKEVTLDGDDLATTPTRQDDSIPISFLILVVWGMAVNTCGILFLFLSGEQLFEAHHGGREDHP